MEKIKKIREVFEQNCKLVGSDNDGAGGKPALVCYSSFEVDEALKQVWNKAIETMQEEVCKNGKVIIEPTEYGTLRYINKDSIRQIAESLKI